MITRRHAHKLVAQTAQELAGAVYERLASKSDEFFAANPSQKQWISREAPKFLEHARAALAETLRLSTDEVERAEIGDALILDASLRRGRTQGIRTAMAIGAESQKQGL